MNRLDNWDLGPIRCCITVILVEELLVPQFIEVAIGVMEIHVTWSCHFSFNIILKSLRGLLLVVVS